MRLLVGLLFIIILFACKKDNIESCTGYENLVGTWIAIDEDNGAKDIVSFTKKGKYIYTSSIGRGINTKIESCENKQGTLEFYNQVWDYMLFRWSEGKETYNETIRYSPNFDTILIRVSAYNHSNETFNSRKRFVKQ